ncbi:MAG: 30S ribosomal protein S12 methylthiotransferase RimO [Tissierellia bacterium]|nr:30S ribosomal protein S12 methylthiotransferase RimO [Tissierellia bacterium]
MNNKKITFVTLGCSKNTIDTYLMQSFVTNASLDLTDDILKAEIIVVNTCGFIGDAKEESIDTIMEVIQYKAIGNCEKIIMTGCLAQRYSRQFYEEVPEVDAIIGTGNIDKINDAIEAIYNGERYVDTDNINNIYPENIYRKEVKTTEYVKISEGCNNFCSYCIIPKLRGKNRSRKIEDIYAEIKYLVSKGAREIILIAQNTTDYGIDLYGRSALSTLISEISRIEDLKWIRIMYLYPDNFEQDLIDEFKNNDKLLNYVDLPLQHFADSVLQRMNRKLKSEDIQNLIDKLKKEIPDMAIRTTFIVGFPGETEEEFQKLYHFIERNKFDRLGVFKYSREENTPAFNMVSQIEEDVKSSRYNKIMTLQAKISEEKMNSKINRVLDVLIEEKIGNTYVGRTYQDAPEIDGVCYIENVTKNLQIGEFVKVKITDALEYDLIGEIYDEFSK